MRLLRGVVVSDSYTVELTPEAFAALKWLADPYPGLEPAMTLGETASKAIEAYARHVVEGVQETFRMWDEHERKKLAP